MNSHKGYSELTLSNVADVDNVFSLPDNSLFICNVYYFYTLNSLKKELTEEKVREITIENNSSRAVIKVENSADMFMYVHTTRDPDHNDIENTSTTLFKYNHKVCEIPSIFNFPSLIVENTLIGIDNKNWLVQYTLSDDSLRYISKLNNKINGFYYVKNNYYLLWDEKNIVGLYFLKESKLVKIKEIKDIFNIKAIQSIDADHFVCSILDDHGNKKTKIKDCITRLQLWEKESLTCTQELMIKGALINKLKRLPDFAFLTDTMIGCDRSNIFIINFKEKHIRTIDMGNLISDFSIGKGGKLSILLSDENEICQIIEIEPDLLYKFYRQLDQGTIQTHINLLEQTSVSLKDEMKEEKKERKNSDESLLTNKGPGFFSAPSTVTSSALTTQDQEIITHAIQSAKIFTDNQSYKKYFLHLPQKILEGFKLALQENELEEKQRQNISPTA